nr:reverse transcriptase domain-containing protein [Tanacetum cinerariifolium]
MKLNPKKCTFRAEEGMFMGHTISKDEIQAWSEKARAIINTPSPKTMKDVQSLNGKLASLNGFLLKAAETSSPFFKTLKRCIKMSDFAWTEEAKKALKEMKIVIFISGRENSRRLAKWAIELGEHDIGYQPRTSVQGQVLAAKVPAEKANLAEDPVKEAEEVAADLWKLFTNESNTNRKYQLHLFNMQLYMANDEFFYSFGFNVSVRFVW